MIEKGEIAGRVTSVVHSRTLNQTIGLAMLAPQLAEAGGEIRIRADHGEMLAARVAVLVVPQAMHEGSYPERRYRIWCDPSFGPSLSETLGAVVVESGGMIRGVSA